MLACFSRYLTGSRSIQLQQGIACVIGKNWFEISQKSWHDGNMKNDRSTTLSMSHLNNFSYNQSSKWNKSIHTEHFNNSCYNQSSKWNKSIHTEHFNNSCYNQSSKWNKSIHIEHLNNSSYNQSSKWNKSIHTETTQIACFNAKNYKHDNVHPVNNQTVPTIKFIRIVYTTVLIGPMFSKQNSCTSSSILN